MSCTIELHMLPDIDRVTVADFRFGVSERFNNTAPLFFELNRGG